MVADALKGNRIIGMVMLQPGHEAEYEGRPPIFPIGCAGLITDFEQLPDGRYNIVLGGLVKFRVIGEDNSRLYRLARVETIPEVLDDQGNGGVEPGTRTTGLVVVGFVRSIRRVADRRRVFQTSRWSTSCRSTCR